MIKKLLQSVREYKTASILSPLFMACEVLMEVMIPTFMAKLIDNGIDMGNMDVILRVGAILAGMALCSLLFGALSGMCAAKAATGLAKNLRQDMFHNVQTFSFSNIDKFSTAGLVTRMTTDVSNVQMAYQMIIRFAARCPVMFVMALVMSFGINAQLACIFLAVSPLVGLALLVLMKKVHPMFERVFHTYDKLNNVVQENLSGIRVVKAYVRENHEIEKFNDVSDSIYKDFSKAQKLLAFTMPLMQFAVYVCILLVSWLGARIIVTSNQTALTTGELMSLISYATQILLSLMMLAQVFVLLTISKASRERIAEVLDETPDLKNPEHPVTEVKDGSIEFNHVDFRYSGNAENWCLKDVDFKIASGATVGIIGGIGSSKSSLVQLIPRLYDVTHGSVKVGGRDVREYNVEVLRENVAMVLQKNELFSGTLKENLRWGNENATEEEIVNACRLAQADSFIRQMPLQYDTFIEQGGTNVSGGQKQRICIARALLKKPKILILDDSTSAVDTKTDALIRKAFREEIPQTTKIIIAQRISSVADADCILVLNEGKIDAVGTHEELIRCNKIYREVYESQQKGGNEHENDAKNA